MKVLLVNKFYRPSGGAERYAQLWSRLLRERGHQVIPFAMRDPRNWPTPYSRRFSRPISFHEKWRPLAALRSIYSFDAARNISRLVREVRPDVVHLHSWCRQLTASILPPLRRAGVPVIQTAHEYHHVCANQHLYSEKTNSVCEACRGGRWHAPMLTRCIRGSRLVGAVACAEWLVNRSLALNRRHIDRVIAPSDFMRRKMIEFGWPASRIEHVPNFLFPGDFDPTPPANSYFLFLGRLVRHKGIFTLLRAMRSSECSTARLVIAGDGPLRAEVERSAAEIGDRVRCVGFLDGAELRDLIQRSLAVIAPSEWYENCPYSILEAMAAGRAVIASRIGGIPELVADGLNGLLFQPGDEVGLARKIAFLGRRVEDAAQMGREGRRLIEARYSPDVHFERMSRIMRGTT